MRVAAWLAALFLVAVLVFPLRTPLDAPAGTGPPSAWGPLSGTGPAQVLVGFQAGQLPAVVPGGTLAGLPVVQRVPQIGLLVVQADLATARTALAALPGVSYVEANGAMVALAVPDDPRYAGQYAPPMMGLPAAWGAVGYGSRNVTVAVVDSGILRTHPDLDATRILAGHDYPNHDDVPDDACGHGTHVSGIVGAATNNGVGVAGMSQPTLLPLKVLTGSCSGSFSDIAQAIVDATDQGARVINLSLGGPTGDSATASAVAYAWDHGVTLVAATGNDGGAVQYPAAYPQVIAVAALNADGSLASYSSRGAAVEAAAPGTGIDSTSNAGGYVTMSGTSMAAAHVSGVLALALGCAPATTNVELRAALDATAQDLGAAGRDATTGYGLVRADRLVARLCGSTPNHAPTAAFTAVPAGLTVRFDGGASTDPDGDALSYAWRFGDGGTATGQVVSHTYAAAGTYTAALTVSDGRNATTLASPVTVAAPPFAATFTPAAGCNTWWVEVRVTAAQPVTAVHAVVDGGSPVALVKQSWGSWAKSFYVAKGSLVHFTASDAAGDVATSPDIAWLGANDPTQPFAATITPRQTTNNWWVEVQVTSNHALGSVEAYANGAWTTLPETSWGTWAKSFYVPGGTRVTFRATDTAGATATSATYTWG